MNCGECQFYTRSEEERANPWTRKICERGVRIVPDYQPEEHAISPPDDFRCILFKEKEEED